MMQAVPNITPFVPSFRADKPTGLSLQEAIDTALESRGAEFRHELGFRTGMACGLSEQTATELAEGVEYFHHASLIFDDLPSMDDATERRGHRCLHLVAGEGQAILAALSLVNRAYTTCWKAASRYPGQAGQAGRLVDRCVGEAGILEGQSRDLTFRSGMGTREVKAIAVGKTGTLLKLTMLLPAVLAGRSLRECILLARLARSWGIAYQGIDDFGDLLFSGESTGKTPLRDLSMERPNLVVAAGIKGAHAEVRKAIQQAEDQIVRLQASDNRWAFLNGFHEKFATKEEAVRSAIEAA